MIFSISTSLTIVCNQCKTPCSTILLRNTGGNIPDSRDHGCYLFLDEVQECANWQGFCQRIAEHEAVTLVITGSSSKLSSEEIATNFRGRSHPHAMAPLSFREFLRTFGESKRLQRAALLPMPCFRRERSPGLKLLQRLPNYWRLPCSATYG